MSNDDRIGMDTAALNELILRSVIDYAIVTMDGDGIVTSCNEGAELILGWAEDDIIGRSADVFFTLEDVARDRPESEMRLALMEGRADDVRWHRRRDGSHFWGSGLMMPLLHETEAASDAERSRSGRPGFVKIFRDRTFQHEANARIAKLENRAALAMRRSGTVGVYDLDIATGIVIADAICAEFHDVPPHAAEEGLRMAGFFHGIHSEDSPEVRRAMEESIKSGGNFDQIYRSAKSDPHPLWIHSQATVELDDDNRPARLSGIVVDITEQQERAHLQEMRLNFVDDVRDLDSAVSIAELATRTIAQTLNASRARYGSIASCGEMIDIRADWNIENGSRLVGNLHYSEFGSFASVLHDGQSVIIADAREDPRVEDPEALEALGIRALVNLPLRERGRLKAVLFITDVRTREWSETEIEFMRAMLERTFLAIESLHRDQERDLMNAELTHRMKNMMAIAQVVVTQTLRGTDDIAEARSSIYARLNALSEAQDVLTRSDHHAAPIHDVVKAALNAFSSVSDRISISGPNVSLTSQQVIGLSLALHELATNAMKHGALSGEEGRVRLEWSEADGAFRLDWQEHAGPATIEPTSRGFGSTILNSVVGSYFQGEAKVTFEPAGIRFSIVGQL